MSCVRLARLSRIRTLETPDARVRRSTMPSQSERPCTRCVWVRFSEMGRAAGRSLCNKSHRLASANKIKQAFQRCSVPVGRVIGRSRLSSSVLLFLIRRRRTRRPICSSTCLIRQERASGGFRRANPNKCRTTYTELLKHLIYRSVDQAR